MINVDKNPNFADWFDVRLFGKLVDNAKSHAKAMQIAKALQKKHKLQYSQTMDKIKELKELIRVLSPLADEGHIQSQQMVINAQIELDEILDNQKAQETFMKFLLAKPKENS